MVGATPFLKVQFSWFEKGTEKVNQRHDNSALLGILHLNLYTRSLFLFPLLWYTLTLSLLSQQYLISAGSSVPSSHTRFRDSTYLAL